MDANAPLLSLILPTRERPEGLSRFLESVVTTTTSLGEIEVVVVIDQDDLASLEYKPDDSVRVIRKIMPRGLTMGQPSTVRQLPHYPRAARAQRP